MPARLNRKRYREIVSLLKSVIADPKATRRERLRAADTLLGVYDRHDRTEADKARRKAAGSAGESQQPAAPAEAPQSAEDAARAFLASIRGTKNAA